MKVLIFTEMKVGEGHYQAAKAISQELEAVLASAVEVKLISGMRVIHPLIEWVIVYFYFLILRVYPSLWRMIYTKAQSASKLQTQFIAWRLVRLLKKEKPDLIICTHPVCIQGLAYLKQKGQLSCQLSVIGTDYTFHSFFVSTYVDSYFVAHERIKERLIKEHQLDPQRIFAYGIPLHSCYQATPSRVSGNALALTDKKIHVLLLGGATCQLPIKKIIQVFTPYQSRFKITVITGKNQKMYQRLREQAVPNFVEVLGYVDNMHEWLSKVDFVVTKPGGLTISEALACGRPCILINPIPGHEEDNKEFLVQEQMGLFVSQLDSLPITILKITENPVYWQTWQEKISLFPAGEATKKIVQKLVNSI